MLDLAAVALDEFRRQESHLQGLLRVEARIAVGVVAVLKVVGGQRAGAARALGHVLARHLEMDAAGHRALRAVDFEEGLDLRHHPLEGPRLVAAGGDGVAVHRVADPDRLPPLALDGPDQVRQVLGRLVGAEPADQRQATGLVLRVEEVDEADQPLRRGRGPAFQADRVANAASVLDMGVVRLPGAVADPEHVAGGGIPVAGRRIDAGQRLLVAEQQRLVARVEIRRAHLLVRLRIDADGAHEVERVRHPARHVGVARGLRRVLHEAEHPALRVVEVGVAARREGAQQVQGRRRLPVGLELPARIGHPRLLAEADAVDDVAAVARQRDAFQRLGRRGARLGELSGDPSDLHHRRAAGEGQHQRHLQEDAEEVADVVGGVLVEALGAVAALEQEGLALADAGQRRLQLACLTGEDERRKARELGLDALERVGVRILGHLLDRQVAPCARCPTLAHRPLPSTSRQAAARKVPRGKRGL
ncbi:hypothetical protein AOPFMNJM_2338 [Methylobacterium jeotgali]|uniref:Uncharacterized protein n=1 Tax=Methylobacterium jeotgali TaxID=381630 RepID=A0ABQ4SZ12_9HYPH|nr:hypothetical protein AOPFMNJM_2338 [Methylobacterium jeotgali]